jgi:lipopolysaccharide export system protein LptA
MSRPHRLRGSIRFAAALWLCGVGLFPAAAQETRPLGTDVIDLTAEGSIDWLRNENKFIAEGNAKIIRNDATIRSDRLIAHFRDKADGGSEVWRVEFHGDIQADFSGTTLTADDAAYEMDDGVFIATGRNLRMVNEDTTLTASDTIEYWDTKNMAVARGNAKMVEDDRTLRGDIVVAYSTAKKGPATAATKSRDGGTKGEEETDIDRIEVFGNVRITSDKQVIRADKLVYDPNADLARLAGSVKITSGDSQFNGEFAVFDFKTETGKMTGGGSSRAHGLFNSKKAPPPARQGRVGQGTRTAGGDQQRQN